MIKLVHTLSQTLLGNPKGPDGLGKYLFSFNPAHE